MVLAATGAASIALTKSRRFTVVAPRKKHLYNVR
jgi:hypothetical protein